MSRPFLPVALKAGGRVLALEAERTIVLDRDEVVKLADCLGTTIVALRGE